MGQFAEPLVEVPNLRGVVPEGKVTSMNHQVSNRHIQLPVQFVRIGNADNPNTARRGL
jgi:hypothetical protein